MPQLSMHSPIGDLTISEEDGRIVSLDWGWGRDQMETPLLKAARQQLDEYFDGTRRTFDLPIAPEGTEFQKKVWRALERIPFGDVRSYGDLAQSLGTAARAVGGACGANPLPILIPCHRVLGKDKDLGGYSGDGGTTTKARLLNLEGVHPES